MGRAFLAVGLGAFVFVFLGCATSALPTEDEDSGTVNPTTDSGAPCTTMCSGKCSDPKTDPENCGKCGTVCPQGATCVQGSCQCSMMGQTKCGNACVDTKTDIANCGKCGTICGNDAGMIPGGGMYGCNMGACGIICPMGKTECNGACVDTKTDNDNCGTCGTTCMSMTEQCMEGLCCAMGNKVCNAKCTDVLGDAMNCGMCGNVCPNNMPSCSNGTCTTSMVVQIFPPSGSLIDPGSASVWGGRYYTMTFAAPKNIIAIEWMANIAANDSMRGGIWNPNNMQKLATGNTVMGSGTKKYYRSTMSFSAAANTPYLIGIFMSNANTVFPRKDNPSFPFTVSGITVSACKSTSTANTDIFPVSANVWGPDFRLEIQ